MPTPSTAKWPKPRSEDEFEDIVVDFLRIRWQDPNAQRHGRRGQRQHGVDVVGRPAWLAGRTAGGQCKNTELLSLGEIVAEVEKATTFPGGLAEFYVVTTADRDVVLQAAVREHFRTNPVSFHVEVIYWPDVVADISLDEALVAKHWKGFGSQASGGATFAPPAWINRTGANEVETTECHCEFLIRPLTMPDLDATELVAEFEKGVLISPRDIALAYLLQQPPVQTNAGFAWSRTHRQYTNVLDKWEMEVSNAGHVARRWSQFSTHPVMLFGTYDLINNIVLPLATYTNAIQAWSLATGEHKRDNKVALRLSAHANKPMRLHDNVNIVESTARYSSPISPEDWQVELEQNLSSGPAQVALRLLNRAVARFVEEVDHPFGQHQRRLVRIDESAYAACLSRIGL